MAKADHIKEQLNNNKNDLVEFWKSINGILPQPTHRDVILEDDAGKEIPTDKTATYINDYFANIGKKLAEQIITPEQTSNIESVERDSRSVNVLHSISLLPLLGKLLDCLVHGQLMRHIEENNLISSTQNGFRKSHSTTQTTFKLVSDL